MQQAVDAAQIHERAVAGDVLHHAAHDLSLGHRFQHGLPLRRHLLVQNRAPADHHVAALAIHLQHADGEFAVFPFVQVAHRMQIGLRRRQKCAHADVHHQAALDVIHDFSGDVGLVAVGLFNLGPGAAPLHALVGQQHHPFLAIAGALDFHRLPDHQRERPIQFREFLRGNQPFGLAAQIHDHAQIGDRHDLARFDFAFRRRLMRRGVLLHELFHLRVRFRRRLAGIQRGFHHFAHVGMFDGGSAIRRGHRLRRSHGNGGRLGGQAVQQRQLVLALELRQAGCCGLCVCGLFRRRCGGGCGLSGGNLRAGVFVVGKHLTASSEVLPCSQQETLGLSSESRGGARKEVRLPTQGPHRGDDTRALWPVSMKAGEPEVVIRNLLDS